MNTTKCSLLLADQDIYDPELKPVWPSKFNGYLMHEESIIPPQLTDHWAELLYLYLIRVIYFNGVMGSAPVSDSCGHVSYV